VFRPLRIAAVSVLCVLASCADENVQGTEKARVSSPDGVVDAVLIVKETDATVATPSELYVVPKGTKPTKSAMIMRGDYFANVSLKWKEPRFLELHYDTGRVFTFKNFWQSAEVSNNSYVVEIRLKPMRDSFSLGSVKSQ